MATGGYDRSLDSRVTCSICLEPYKGRQPKLLPCFHSFCLPCLTQIANRHDSQRVSGAGDGISAAASQTLTCPTCRTPVPLPPAGVSGLHNNVYADDSGDHDPQTFRCDLCEEDQNAKLKCSACKAYFCTRCRRFHDRLCTSGTVTEIEVQQRMDEQKTEDQVEQAVPLEFVDILQAALKQLSGKAGQQPKQGATSNEARTLEKTLSPPVSRTSVAADVTDIKSLAAAVQQIIQKQTETEKLVNCLHGHVTTMQNQNALLCRDLASLHEKNSGQRKELDAFQREVVSLKDKNAILCQDNQLLRTDVTRLQDCVSTLRGEVDKQQCEISQFKTHQTQVQGDIKSLKNSQVQLQKEMAALKTEHCLLQADLKSANADRTKLQNTLTSLEKEKTKMQDESNKLKAQLGKLESNLDKTRNKMQDDLKELKSHEQSMESKLDKTRNKFQDDLKELKSHQGFLESNLDKTKNELKDELKELKSQQGILESNLDKTRNNLQSDLKKISTQVAFHARIENDIQPKEDDIIVFNYVQENIGSAYNNTTGIFTAPVSGVYCFIACATPYSSDDTDKFCCADLVIDGKELAHLLAFHPGNCTAHISLSVEVGQKVWLKPSDNNSYFHAGWLTSFTGFLVQPDL